MREEVYTEGSKKSGLEENCTGEVGLMLTWPKRGKKAVSRKRDWDDRDPDMDKGCSSVTDLGKNTIYHLLNIY